MLAFLLHTSNLLQFHAVFKHIEDDADYRSRMTIYTWHPQTSLSPGSTNLKLKFWSSVELNSFCAFTSHSLSLSHTVALTSGLGPGLTCHPKLPKVFPSFPQDPTATSSTCPQWMGTVHTGGVSCLQGPSTNPEQEAPQSRPCFSSGHRNSKHLLMHGKCHHNQPNPSV